MNLKKIFYKKLFPFIQNLSPTDALEKLEQLEKAQDEIIEKILKHPHPDEVPKMTSVLEKYDEMIEALKSVIPENLIYETDSVGTLYEKLPGGTFEMGHTDFIDNLPRQVRIRHFYMAKTLVTQKQWRKVMGNSTKPMFDRKTLNKNTEDHPMEQVSWVEAVKYCIKLSLNSPDLSKEQKSVIKELDPHEYIRFALENPQFKIYRLPTETEWEYAAKAGRNYEYGTPDGKIPTDDTVIWNRDFNSSTLPVKSMKPNKFGLYDMAGHLNQWTATWYDPLLVVIRGGSFVDADPEILRASHRKKMNPQQILPTTGFRVVRNRE